MRRIPTIPLGLALLATNAAAHAQTIAGLPPEASAGRGAALPFLEYEAETATTKKAAAASW